MVYVFFNFAQVCDFVTVDGQLAVCVGFQVEKKRQEDAANDVKIAKSLEGFLERKVRV